MNLKYIQLILMALPIIGGIVFGYVDIKAQLASHATQLTSINDNIKRLDTSVATLNTWLFNRQARNLNSNFPY